jgi:hypothetical protein
MTPKVSICVPNLNTLPFLPERFRTIFDQSFEDWELLVYDSYSTDGAWDYIRDVASREPRMRAWQGPREGTPASWTPCIREARGEYVYIATSDDTMPPDCLEKLVAALDRHPECDIAHCPLRAIDERGADVVDVCRWWAGASIFAESSGLLRDHPHVRRAPFDGLLHLLGVSVYISVTQLLVRRTLFDRIGSFESRWGSVGDFAWAMRAGLVADVVHVPDTWGGWRIHLGQATADAALGSAEHSGRIDAMIDDAIETCAGLLSPAIGHVLMTEWKPQAATFRTYRRMLGNQSGRLGRLGVLCRGLLSGSAPAREHLRLRLQGRPMSDWVVNRLKSIDIPDRPPRVPLRIDGAANVIKEPV